MAHPFVDVELQTTDLARFKAIYSELFDWKLEDIPAPGGEMPYTPINVGERAGGGMLAHPDPQTPSHGLVYVAVDDIDTFMLKPHDFGATVLQDAMAADDHGWLSMIRDSSGAVIGMRKPKRGL